jgi:hypothetical protein
VTWLIKFEAGTILKVIFVYYVVNSLTLAPHNYVLSFLNE